MICKKCGKKNEKGEYCKYCGAEIMPPSNLKKSFFEKKESRILKGKPKCVFLWSGILLCFVIYYFFINK